LDVESFWYQNSEVEYLGIKLTDGLYDDSNKQYYIAYNKDNALKTGLPFVMHQADIMAARFENERWLKLKQGSTSQKNVGGRPTKKQKLENVHMPDKIDFKSIFGDVEEA
jgi:hypothetical protein